MNAISDGTSQPFMPQFSRVIASYLIKDIHVRLHFSRLRVEKADAVH